jgi:hypothetical protein
MEMSWSGSTLVEFGSGLEYGMGGSSYAWSLYSIWARPTPFLPSQLCSPLHACCRLATSANLDILGLVPSNPRHNTSIKSFEVLWSGDKPETCCAFVAADFWRSKISGDKAETCCGFVSASFLLCCCLTSFSELLWQQCGNMYLLSNSLSSLKTLFALLEQSNGRCGDKVDTCFRFVSALPLFHSIFHSMRSKCR